MSQALYGKYRKHLLAVGCPLLGAWLIYGVHLELARNPAQDYVGFQAVSSFAGVATIAVLCLTIVYTTVYLLLISLDVLAHATVRKIRRLLGR